MSTITKFFISISTLIIASCSGKYSILDPAGPASTAVAWIWWGMMIVTVLLVLGICCLWFFAMFKSDKDYSPSQTRKILTWFMSIGGIGVPTIAIIVLLIFGIPAGNKMVPLLDDNTLRINVHAQQWFWTVSYPEKNISLTDKIYIPVGSPVDIFVTSEDVIHGFWVPRLGGKIDAIPGRTNVIRLQADKPGEYGGMCAEYCGRNHTFMHFSVFALEQDNFQRWLASQENKGDANAQ